MLSLIFLSKYLVKLLHKYDCQQTQNLQDSQFASIVNFKKLCIRPAFYGISTCKTVRRYGNMRYKCYGYSKKTAIIKYILIYCDFAKTVSQSPQKYHKVSWSSRVRAYLFNSKFFHNLKIDQSPEASIYIHNIHPWLLEIQTSEASLSQYHCMPLE